MEKTPKKPRKQKKEQGSINVKSLALFLPAGLLCYAACFLLAAVLTHTFHLQKSNDFYLAVFSLCAAAFATSYFAASKLRRNGMLVGLLSCLPFHLVFLLISLFACGWDADWTLLFSFVILTLTSMLGGVLAVNRRQKANPTQPRHRKGRKT